MMLYMMPAMMTFVFLKFASGLNLYYTVMNLASLPQQWSLSRERLRRNPTVPAAAPKKRQQ
jgi:membrane protein insertase Oxa1/YidC/SpoIIIJ